jgi:hypothetical protein
MKLCIRVFYFAMRQEKVHYALYYANERTLFHMKSDVALYLHRLLAIETNSKLILSILSP